VLFFFDFF